MSDSAGAAKRRRDRGLRAWHRHVRTTVAKGLAPALHHSAQRVEVPREREVHEKHDGPRAQKRPLPGTRPAPPAEVSEPQVRAATVGYVAARGLSSRCHRWLGVTASTAPPSATSSGTPSRCVRCWRGGEEEGRGEGEGEGGALLSFLGSQEDEEEREDASTSSWCTDTAMWAWVPLSLFVVWCLLDIIAGACQKDRCALIVSSGSGLCKAGYVGYCGPRSMFPSVDDRPKMLDIMAGTDQKNSHALRMCKVGFTGDSAPRAVFLSLSSGPRCATSWPVWVTWWCCACCVQQQVPWVTKCRKLRIFRSCSYIPVMTLWPLLMVQTVRLTTEIPQLLYDIVINVPVVGRAVPAPARAVRTWNLDIISRPWIWQSCPVLVT